MGPPPHLLPVREVGCHVVTCPMERPTGKELRLPAKSSEDLRHPAELRLNS